MTRPEPPPEPPGGWRVELHDRLPSTNTTARDRPPWTAVRALSQTGGRGRFDRAWFSPPGGLWVTLVLPHTQPPGGGVSAGPFPLAAGHTLVETLRRLGVQDARLRWPNDLMIGDRKTGGLLMELQPGRRLLLGIGLNIANPLPLDPPPDTPATRLADHLSPCPSPEEVLAAILEAVTALHSRFFREGFAPFMRAINSSLTSPRPVAISLLTGGRVTGLYAGVDEAGNPVLRGEDGGFTVVPASEVARLAEL